MGDGAREITRAGEEVFGKEGVRLMCWPHTYRNLVNNMSKYANYVKKRKATTTIDSDGHATVHPCQRPVCLRLSLNSI